MTALERLIALVKRELAAEDVRVVETDNDDDAPLALAIPGGKRIVVRFAGEIDDLEARKRRLEMLVDSFGETLRSSSASRPPAGQSLHAELQVLAQRAGALDALVIDAQSPVVWGAAEDDDAAPHLMARDNVVSLDAHRPSADGQVTPPPPPVDPGASLRAVEAVRAHPSIPTLHRGGHLHHVERRESLGFVARSFAGIYVLLVVFEGAFDELRAERAIAHALPTIERLVTALPPLDPSPMSGAAAAIRRPRRRS